VAIPIQRTHGYCAACGHLLAVRSAWSTGPRPSITNTNLVLIPTSPGPIPLVGADDAYRSGPNFLGRTLYFLLIDWWLVVGADAACRWACGCSIACRRFSR
jgi:hypothetical protein